jgi:hypothetical protein
MPPSAARLQSPDGACLARHITLQASISEQLERQCCGSAGLTHIEATAAGSTAWTDHVIEASEGLPFAEVDSRTTGINRNVEGSRSAA